MAELTQDQRVKMALARNNSRPLDVWRISEYPQAKAAITDVFSEMKAEGLTNKRYAKKLRDHIRAIVLDLFVAGDFTVMV